MEPGLILFICVVSVMSINRAIEKRKDYTARRKGRNVASMYDLEKSNINIRAAFVDMEQKMQDMHKRFASAILDMKQSVSGLVAAELDIMEEDN